MPRMRKSERMMFMYWNQRHLYGHTRVVKTGSPAFWPHDVMRHPAVVETATRNKASGTTLSALTHSFVTATSGDHSKINMNAKTAYKSVDDVVASAALRAVKLHLWYLTPELLPLCLFSSAVDDHLKAKIVKENVKHPKKASMTNRDGTDFGKPKFPDIPLSEEETSLLNFVGEYCWRFFRIMKIDSSFLDSPVSSWHLSAEYMDAVKVVNNMCVVNNAAERGVKLCSDFITCARNENPPPPDVSSNPPRKKIQPPRKDSNPPRLGVVLALKGGLRVVSEQKLY